MPDEPMTDNGALNAIAEQMDELVEFLTNRYDDVTGSAAFTPVNDTLKLTRAADSRAIQINVSNMGPDSVLVKEDNVVIGVVPANDFRIFKPGSGAIGIKCLTGDSAMVALATYQKSA